MSSEERKVFMKYMRNTKHEFTKFVTHLFLTFLTSWVTFPVGHKTLDFATNVAVDTV
jgi:hypothetical protein